MKKSAIVVFAVLPLILFGCGGGGASVSQEDAKEAFAVSFSGVMMASISAAFGQAPEGVEMSEDGLSMTLNDFDLSQYGEMPYTVLNGTVTNIEGGMAIDLKLEGDGPVKTISYELNDMGDGMESLATTVTVNGKDMDVEITADDMASM